MLISNLLTFIKSVFENPKEQTHEEIRLKYSLINNKIEKINISAEIQLEKWKQDKASVSNIEQKWQAADPMIQKKAIQIETLITVAVVASAAFTLFATITGGIALGLSIFHIPFTLVTLFPFITKPLPYHPAMLPLSIISGASGLSALVSSIGIYVLSCSSSKTFRKASAQEPEFQEFVKNFLNKKHFYLSPEAMLDRKLHNIYFEWKTSTNSSLRDFKI